MPRRTQGKSLEIIWASPATTFSFDHFAHRQHLLFLPWFRDNLHADGQTFRRTGDRDRCRRHAQQVEPFAVTPGVEVVHSLSIDCPTALAMAEGGQRSDRA